MSESKETDNKMLSPYRVLDLTDEKGFLCGKLLGDLGADVIKIEPPGGDPSRKLGPFYHDIPDQEKSLYWFAFNTNKRGITLNIETEDGKAIFKELGRAADIVVESFSPGYMDKLGIGYSELSKTNPGIIFVSITPFGTTGPYKKYKGSDLVVTALSGYLYLCGEADRAPVRISFPQAFLHAAAEAAAGTMIALYYRQVTGEGQRVDTSAQCCIAKAAMDAPSIWQFLNIDYRRKGSTRTPMGAINITTPLHFECKDGYVLFSLYGGQVGAHGNAELTSWMDSEGLATDFLKSIDWSTFSLHEVTQDTIDGIVEPVAKFIKSHTKKELHEGAVKRHIMLFPLNSPSDMLQSEQLRAREYWVDVEHPELGGKLTYPGPFAKLSETPIEIQKRAPLIGEHNQDIYIHELGFSKEKVISLMQANVI